MVKNPGWAIVLMVVLAMVLGAFIFMKVGLTP